MRRIFIVGLAVLPLLAYLSPPLAHAAANDGVGVSTNGLYLYYDFANPNSYSGSGTTLSDLSGNNLTGSILNAPTLQRSSTSGTYFSFAGGGLSSSDAFQHITVPTHNVDFSNGFSFSFYGYFGSTAGSFERIFDFGADADAGGITDGNAAANNNVLFGRHATTNQVFYETLDLGTPNRGRCYGPDTGTTGAITAALQQFTVTIDSTGTCLMYLNGSSIAVTTQITAGKNLKPSNINRDKNYIARSNWADANFEGFIYRLAFYNRKLDASEVTQNYNSLIDTAWPTLSATINSVNENTTAVTTFSPNSNVYYTISGGVDSARFTINNSTGALAFVTAPNFENPLDSGGDNVYNVVVRGMDPNGNYKDYAAAITVANVSEGTTLTLPSLTATPSKGVSLTITVTPAGDGTSIPGRVTYLIAGKRIPGCLKRTYSGTGNSTCVWKPTIQGFREITATFTPTNNSFSASTSKQSFFILKRTTTR